MAASQRSRELRLPTKIVSVRLAIVGSLPTNAEMFISDVPRRGRGHLLDDLAVLVCGEANFLPMRSSGRVRLLGKQAISWIAVRKQDPDELPPIDLPIDLADEPPEELVLYDRQHLVEIELAQATKLVGTLLDSSHADRPRVIDHLNLAGRFLRLWTASEHYFININQVVAVTELEAK